MFIRVYGFCEELAFVCSLLPDATLPGQRGVPLALDKRRRWVLDLLGGSGAFCYTIARRP